MNRWHKNTNGVWKVTSGLYVCVNVSKCSALPVSKSHKDWMSLFIMAADFCACTSLWLNLKPGWCRCVATAVLSREPLAQRPESHAHKNCIDLDDLWAFSTQMIPCQNPYTWHGLQNAARVDTCTTSLYIWCMYGGETKINMHPSLNLLICYESTE